MNENFMDGKNGYTMWKSDENIFKRKTETMLAAFSQNIHSTDGMWWNNGGMVEYSRREML